MQIDFVNNLILQHCLIKKRASSLASYSMSMSNDKLRELVISYGNSKEFPIR